MTPTLLQQGRTFWNRRLDGFTHVGEATVFFMEREKVEQHWRDLGTMPIRSDVLITALPQCRIYVTPKGTVISKTLETVNMEVNLKFDEPGGYDTLDYDLQHETTSPASTRGGEQVFYDDLGGGFVLGECLWIGQWDGHQIMDMPLSDATLKRDWPQVMPELFSGGPSAHDKWEGT